MQVADYNTAVKKVMADEIDALVADMPICVLTIMRHPGKGLATLTQPLTVEPVGIAMPMGDPQLKGLLDSYIDRLRGDRDPRPAAEEVARGRFLAGAPCRRVRPSRPGSAGLRCWPAGSGLAL